MSRHPLLAGIVLLGLSASALATPPWFVEWARTVSPGHLMIRPRYISVDNFQGYDSRTQSLPRTQFAYGLTDNAEASVTFANVEKIGKTSSDTQWADTQFAAKYRFFGASSSPNQIGLAYYLNLPTGSPSSGFGSGGYDNTLQLLASHALGPGQIHAALGENVYQRAPFRSNTLYGLMYTEKFDKGNTEVGLQFYGNGVQKAGGREEQQIALGATTGFTPLLRGIVNFSHSWRSSGNTVLVGLQYDLKVTR